MVDLSEREHVKYLLDPFYSLFAVCHLFLGLVD